MRKVHLVLRLFFAANMSIRAIARAVETSPSTVGDYVRRAQFAGLSWPLPEDMSGSLRVAARWRSHCLALG